MLELKNKKLKGSLNLILHESGNENYKNLLVPLENLNKFEDLEVKIRETKYYISNQSKLLYLYKNDDTLITITNLQDLFHLVEKFSSSNPSSDVHTIIVKTYLNQNILNFENISMSESRDILNLLLSENQNNFISESIIVDENFSQEQSEILKSHFRKQSKGVEVKNIVVYSKYQANGVNS